LIVVDASVLVDALLAHGPARTRIADESLLAPHLVDAEVGNALRRLVHHGELAHEAASEALGTLRELEVERFAHPPLVSRAWELRQSATFYDALYIALAEALEVTLVTADAALARVPRVRTNVEVVAHV
jgi:predicted nucleic acid-binding protein